MTRLTKSILWTLLFLGMLLAIDQFLVKVPPVNPAHAAISHFYRDFRGRIFDLIFGGEQAGPASIEAVIEDQGKRRRGTGSTVTAGQGQSQPPASRQNQARHRFVYADARGELQFADSLEEVPEEFREQAQPMGE